MLIGGISGRDVHIAAFGFAPIIEIETFPSFRPCFLASVPEKPLFLGNRVNKGRNCYTLTLCGYPVSLLPILSRGESTKEA